MEYVKSETKHSKTAYRALTISGLSFLSAVFGVIIYPFFLSPIAMIFSGLNIFPFFLSPIAMIFSHLSKGRLKARHFAAQLATVIAILAYIINIGMIAYGVYTFQNDAYVRNSFNTMLENVYGMSLDEYTEMIINETKVMLPNQKSE